MFSILFLCASFISNSNAFVPKKQCISYKPKNIMVRRSLEIDNDNPSFIAKSLYQEFHKFGLSQPYDGFVEQLKNKQVESVSLITQKNEINGLISIDTLHKPHEYDMINSHVVQIVPSMTQSLLDKLDTMGIKYDLLFLLENQ